MSHDNNLGFYSLCKATLRFDPLTLASYSICAYLEHVNEHVNEIGHHFFKQGISLKDLHDVILTRADSLQNMTSQGACNANSKLRVKLP